MALFNFKSDQGRGRREAALRDLQQSLYKPGEMTTQPMEGPLLAGQARPDITAQNEATGLLSGRPEYAKFVTSALGTQYGGDVMKGLLSQMGGGGQAGYKNVTQDDLGNWYGLSPTTGQVEQIPVTGGDFTKYKSVQSVDSSGRPIVELVSPGLLKKESGDSRITVGKKSFSEGQTTSATFADQMVRATKGINSLVKEGFNPANFEDYAAGKIPIVGNYMASDAARLYRQSQESWVRAKLRKESGAVIGADEMRDEISTYFPKPGDSPAVIKQKSKARETATRGLVNQSQGAFEALNPDSYQLYKKPGDRGAPKKSIADMTDAELEAIINGN